MKKQNKRVEHLLCTNYFWKVGNAVNIITNYGQYKNILENYKRNHHSCITNKLMTKSEIEELIVEEKLCYEQCASTLWFFVNEGYFYSGSLFIPKDEKIDISDKKMSVRVELMGNQQRYDYGMENRLLECGFIKYDKHLEYSRELKEIIDDIDDYIIRNNNWKDQEINFRYARSEDYDQLWSLWLSAFGNKRYTIVPFTNLMIEKMEKEQKCLVAVDKDQDIVASWMYSTRNRAAYGYNLATKVQGKGLGKFILYRGLSEIYKKGYTKYVGWLRDDNISTLKIHNHILKPTGKYYWQYVYKTNFK